MPPSGIAGPPTNIYSIYLPNVYNGTLTLRYGCSHLVLQDLPTDIKLHIQVCGLQSLDQVRHTPIYGVVGDAVVPGVGQHVTVDGEHPRGLSIDRT